MVLSGVFFFNLKGEILISRVYRDDITKAVAEVFRLQVVGAKDVRSPIKTIVHTHIIHIRVENVYVMTATKANVNISTVFEVLYKIVSLLRSAFGGHFNEEGVRNNYILIYELLDEILDHGYPQSTGDELFKLYITQKGKFSQKKNALETGKATAQVTGAIPWRTPDLKYKKNEIFIDAIENVNILYSNTGSLLHADVAGEIKMKCYLSGMPECRFGMNDKLLMDRESGAGGAPGGGPPGNMAPGNKGARVGNGIEIDDCTFHQCVKLGKFDAERSITFIPPDGEFTLMKYRTTENIQTPFRVIPIVNETSTRVEIKVTVKADFHNKMVGNDVVISVPTPKNTAVCKVQVQHGRAKYEPAHNAIIWRIKRFPGEAEYTLGAEIELISTNKFEKNRKGWVRPPIAMQFSVPMFTASGLHVRFLKVVEPKMQYQTIKWVRYVTQAGSYQHRI